MSILPTDATPSERVPFRVLVSGALNLLPEIDALLARGAAVIASDRDAAALTAAASERTGLICLPADLDLTLDAHRLAVAADRIGCDVLVHHMGNATVATTPASAATAFLRAMRLIHAVHSRVRHGRAGALILTGHPEDCVRSLRIVLDRAGTFCGRTGLTVAQCAPGDVMATLDDLRAASLARVDDTVALAG